MHLRSEKYDNITAREALEQLQFAGIETFTLSSDSPEARRDVLLDLYSTRILLEERAARLAAQHLTDGDIGAIERVAGAIEATAQGARLDGDLARDGDLAQLHRELHFTIYHASKRPHLVKMIEGLWEECALLSDQYEAGAGQADEGALFAIRSIVSACKLRDSNALGLMIRYKIHQRAAPLCASDLGEPA